MTDSHTPHIDFWFSVGSTYTYLSVMRLASIEREHGVCFNWRPFSVRTIMGRIGNSPFIGKPIKAQYMWRDIERRAQTYGLAPSLPADYPLENFDLANQLAILASRQGWCPQYVESAYRAWFHDGVMPGSDKSVTICLESAGMDVAETLRLAQSEENQSAYNIATHEAAELGIFGSPSFVVAGSELFWGDDRLDDAVRWAHR